MSEKKVYKSPSGLEAEIILGNCYTGNQKNMQLWSSNVYWVREDIRNIKTSYIKLGFHLYEIKRCNAYCIYGYDDFYEFCDNNFHLSSSTVRRHIQLYRRFGEYRDNSMKMNIAQEYEKYSYSQLCEMLPMSNEEIEGIRSSMTIKEIREYKLNLKEEKLRKLSSHLDSLSKESDEIVYTCTYASYVCNIKDIIKKHFMKNGNTVGCAGCCSCCLNRYSCEYVCAYVQENVLTKSEEEKPDQEVCDVAQIEPDQNEVMCDVLQEDDVFVATSVFDGIIGLLNDAIKFMDDGDCDTASQMLYALRNRLNSFIEVD